MEEGVAVEMDAVTGGAGQEAEAGFFCFCLQDGDIFSVCLVQLRPEIVCLPDPSLQLLPLSFQVILLVPELSLPLTLSFGSARQLYEPWNSQSWWMIRTGWQNLGG